MQVFYLQQNHARITWPRGTRCQNFCFMGMKQHILLLIKIFQLKANFLFSLFLLSLFHFVHLLGGWLLMHIISLGRGLTIWSMIIATMVTLNQLLGNVIATTINQTIHFIRWSSLLIFSFADTRSWPERWWRPGAPSSFLFVNGNYSSLYRGGAINF